jgi:mono/diheme cytochrome c family protein
MSGRMRTGTWIIILSIAAWGSWRAIPARAGDEIDRVLSEAGKARYEQYCTECHGPGGAPGSQAKVDLRTYVARHGGKFPAADWLAIIADARPASPHARVWEHIRKDQVGTSGNAAARAVVGEIARYVGSIQSK